MLLEYEQDDKAMRRGRPRAEIPQEVRDAADQTYATGQVARVEIGPDDGPEADQLVLMLKRYAKYQVKTMIIRREGNVMRFRMVEKRRRQKSA